MNEATYMKERVDDQINWLDGKSGKNQRFYKRLRLIVILLSVLIPFATGYIGNWEGNIDEILKFSIGMAGVIIAAIEGIQSLFKYQDNWVSYRVTAETLKQEKMLYLTKSGIYANNKTNFQAFVSRIEGILNGENQQWLQNMLEENNNEVGEENA
ncbi:MAG: DUF4231 domain-containing protein [Bacteroidota bacterium]